MSFHGYVIGVIVAIVLFSVASFSSVSVIDTGYRGIKTRYGVVEGQPLSEGIYFTSPFTTSIHEMDIRTQKYTGKADAYTKDMQTVSLEYVVNVSLDGAKVGELFKEVGTNYEDKLIPQAALGIMKGVVGKWDGALPEYMGANMPVPFLGTSAIGGKAVQ